MGFALQYDNKMITDVLFSCSQLKLEKICASGQNVCIALASSTSTHDVNTWILPVSRTFICSRELGLSYGIPRRC